MLIILCKCGIKLDKITHVNCGTPANKGKVNQLLLLVTKICKLKYSAIIPHETGQQLTLRHQGEVKTKNGFLLKSR